MTHPVTIFHGPFRIALSHDGSGYVASVALCGKGDFFTVREDLDESLPPRVWVDKKRTQEDR